MSCRDCLVPNKSPVKFSGNLKGDILFLFDGPSPYDKRIEAHKILKIICDNIGFSLNNVFFASSYRCYFDKENFTGGQINTILENCRDSLDTVLNELKPKLIVCFGALAFQAAYKKSTLKKARNQFFYDGKHHIVVTYNPFAAKKDPSKLPSIHADLSNIKRFIDNGYKAENVITYKEVQTIRPILDGDCLKEGNFYLTGIDSEGSGVKWYDPNDITISYQVSKNEEEGWTVILHEECEVDSGDFNIFVPRGGTKKDPILVEIGVKKSEGYNRKIEELQELLKRQDFKKYFFNQKFEQHHFMNLGITEFNNCCIDARVLAHTLDSNRYKNCSLDDLISEYTIHPSHKGAVSDTQKSDMFGLLKNDRKTFIKYASLDPVLTLIVTQELKKEIYKDEKSLNYFIKFAQPIENEFLFEMERNGIKVDKAKIPDIKKKLKTEMETLLLEFKDKCPSQVYKKHKDNFKLTRTIIMQESLFKWADTKFRKNQTEPEIHNYGFNLEPIEVSAKSGTPSTDKKQVLKVLLDGKCPAKAKKLIQIFIDWAERRQMVTNFLKNLEQSCDVENRIHASFSITFTSSGRVGARNPNLQNIPKRGPLAKLIREVLIADKDQELIENDYKASELAWVAQVSGDKKMTKIFKEGKDPHRIVGLSMKHLPEDYEFKTTKELKDLRQHTKCFHPDTEVLTEDGWKKLTNLKKEEKIYQAEPKDNDRVKLSLVKPTLLELRKNHCDNLVSLKNEGIDLKVTPDHRMLIQRFTGKYDVVDPKDLNKCRYYINSGLIEDGIEIDERLLRLMVLTQADGSYSNSTIRFGFKKQKKIKRFESLFREDEYTKNKVGIKYSYTSYHIKPGIGKKIRLLLDEDKTFKWNCLKLSKKCRDIIIDEARYWDSHKAKNWNQYIYSSTIEKNIDVLQAICAISGIKTNKRSEQDKRHPEHSRVYYLSIKKTYRSRGGNVITKTEPYLGDVAVISVPSSFIMVRSGGKVLITGQCINFGLIYLMTAYTLVKYAKQEYDVTFTKKQAQEMYDKYFSDHSGIKLWHEKDLQFLRKHGYLRTIFGRKQILPNIYSDNNGTAAAAERTGINSMIQGPSSDMTLLSGHRIIKDPRVNNDEIKIVLFIHDSLIWSCIPSKRDYYLSIVKEHMEYIPDSEFGFKMNVPLSIEAEIGQNLAEMKGYEI